MSEEEKSPQDTKQYYVLGIIVLIAVVVAGYLLRPKSGSMTTPAPDQQQQVMAPTPTPGPITELACDQQYFNPRIGYSEYYLSVEGGDVSNAKKVDCTFTVMVDDKSVATEKASSPLTESPQRGGSTFRCTTKAVALTAGVPSVVDISLKDDLGKTATCSGAFTFPAP